jgi:hypothetical protein
VAIADGAETISDLAVLRDQPDLFGPVASHPTVWRTLKQRSMTPCWNGSRPPEPRLERRRGRQVSIPGST